MLKLSMSVSTILNDLNRAREQIHPVHFFSKRFKGQTAAKLDVIDATFQDLYGGLSLLLVHSIQRLKKIPNQPASTLSQEKLYELEDALTELDAEFSHLQDHLKKGQKRGPATYPRHSKTKLW